MFIAKRLFVIPALCVLFAAMTGAQQEKHYDRVIDFVFLTENGVDFYMDVFTPNGKPALPAYKPNEVGKGRGIIDICSGAWHTDRGKIGDHETAQVYDILTAHGFTVFAIRPGDRKNYIVPQMLGHIEHAIRYVKANAKKYNVDPDKLGLTGASAGGHLSLMTLVSAKPGGPKANDPLLKFGTDIRAAAIFFPPTDFLDWEGTPLSGLGPRIGDILVKGGYAGHSQEEIEKAARAASPFRLLEGKKLPPIIIFHGDADPLVPLSQSQKFVDAVKKQGGDATLVVKPGGTHPWITIPLEVLKIADWFGEHLK